MGHVLAIEHVPFEDLGSLGQELARRGIGVQTVEACTPQFESLDLLAPELVVVLGGPIGVYDSDAYPFLSLEIARLRDRLARRLPTLGICLGAQLMAAALGARVYPGSRGKEIGWSALKPGDGVEACPAIEHLLAPGVEVLHWHGDTFDLPAGVAHLAASELYPNQAWSLGERILALQFHPEVTAANLERWYVGHACELAAAGVDVARLRAAGRKREPALCTVAERFFRTWLDAAIGDKRPQQTAGTIA
jgi:GMP synthase (glutamine-hydrolysing)